MKISDVIFYILLSVLCVLNLVVGVTCLAFGYLPQGLLILIASVVVLIVTVILSLKMKKRTVIEKLQNDYLALGDVLCKFEGLFKKGNDRYVLANVELHKRGLQIEYKQGGQKVVYNYSDMTLFDVDKTLIEWDGTVSGYCRISSYTTLDVNYIKSNIDI